MKKYTTSIIVLVILMGGIFLIADKQDAHAPNVQDTENPMGKISLADTDPAVIAECNQQLTTTQFESELESDAFFAECITDQVNNGDESPDKAAQNPLTFTGELEKVDTGCFADGECFVVVDGKHVTVLLGRSRDVVGQVLGIETGFGGLEGLVGKEIEVYAHKIDAKNYTLYGSADYYIKVL